MRNKTGFTLVIFTAISGVAIALLGGGCNRREKDEESRRAATYSRPPVLERIAPVESAERQARTRKTTEKVRKEEAKRKGDPVANSKSGIPDSFPTSSVQFPARKVAEFKRVEEGTRLEKEPVPSRPGGKRVERLDPAASPVMRTANRLLEIYEATEAAGKKTGTER